MENQFSVSENFKICNSFNFSLLLFKQEEGNSWRRAQYWESILCLCFFLIIQTCTAPVSVVITHRHTRVDRLPCVQSLRLSPPWSLWWCCYEECQSGTNQLLVVWLFNSSHIYCLKGIVCEVPKPPGPREAWQCNRWWRVAHNTLAQQCEKSPCWFHTYLDVCAWLKCSLRCDRLRVRPLSPKLTTGQSGVGPLQTLKPQDEKCSRSHLLDKKRLQSPVS